MAVSMREAVPYAVETTYRKRLRQIPLPTTFEIVGLTVIYADSDKPSHSVRIFLHQEENS